jgi:hypothetical protein
VSFVHGERRPSSPLIVLHSWSVELTFPSLLTVAGPLPATVAQPRQRNAAAEPEFFPSPSTRSSGELFFPPPCPADSLTVMGARPPPFALPPPLWHRRSGMPRAVAGHTGRGRPSERRSRAAHPGHTHVAMGRARAVCVGQAPLCNWAERGFGPVTLELVFLFSEYIQILTNLKICVGFI